MNVMHPGPFRYRQGRVDLSPDIVHTILQVITAGWAVASKDEGATRVAHEEALNELLRDGMAPRRFKWVN